MINHALLLEQNKIPYDPDTFWMCISLSCLVVLFMFIIQYSIYFWERRKEWKNSTSKKRKV